MKPTSFLYYATFLLLGLAGLGSGCSGETPPPTAPTDPANDSDADTDTDTDGEEEEGEGWATASRGDLRLKRWRQLEQDLGGALRLPADTLCRETGLYDCTDLHVVPLGGVSVPNGLYRPVETISATTGLAVERLVMQACFNRLRLDQALVAGGSSPEVFGAGLDIQPGASGADSEALAALVTVLYQRLLARDPLDAEVAALAGLHGTLSAAGGANADWALMACFSVGTTTEALAY